MKSLSIQANNITGNGVQQQLPWHGLKKPSIEPANHDDTNNWIYVVGKINALFPSLSLEQEFLQASQIAGTPPPANSMASDQVELEQINSQPQQSKWLYNGLSQPQNLYIAREMNWVLENTDNNHLFSLLPTSNQCLLQLISALSPDTGNIILVGQRLADGRVAVSNITATNTPALQQVAQQEQSKSTSFTQVVNELLSLNANNGESDAERAINFTLYNNDKIYTETYGFCYQPNTSGANPSGYQLVNVQVKTQTSGDRLIAKVIFHYQGINTGASQSWYCAVDVTGEYPFITVPWKQHLCH
ncbi:hypothetical protein [Shewanella waksmanii]|uniref:cyanobactin maturation protease PatG family protein n=1 Tax=Shewanella waksmanii TaxID=213783 RepID=UPI0004BBBD8A|nr:hypothetical protein [Shewanella waksmanii]